MVIIAVLSVRRTSSRDQDSRIGKNNPVMHRLLVSLQSFVRNGSSDRRFVPSPTARSLQKYKAIAYVYPTIHVKDALLVATYLTRQVSYGYQSLTFSQSVLSFHFHFQ
jgi:hypothetical protein